MPLLASKKINNKTLAVEQVDRVLVFTETQTPVTDEAKTTMFSPPAPSATVQISLHATDLTTIGRLPKVNNPEFLEYINDALKDFGAKSLLAVDRENVEAMEKLGYKVCNNSEMALIPYEILEKNLNNLASQKMERQKDFVVLLEKLQNDEWDFIYGTGEDFLEKVDIDKLYEFYLKHCPFISGGPKDLYKTYSKDGIVARFGYPDSTVMSFAIVTRSGEVVAANHLLFTQEEKESIAYSYDNVVHEDYRSHSPEDTKHTYEFFLKLIAGALTKEKRKPEWISIILGAQGQAGHGKHLREVLIGESIDNKNLPVLMFKGAAPGPLMVANIETEKQIALAHLAELNAAKNLNTSKSFS